MLNILSKYCLKSRILENVVLAPYTSFKIGGRADLFILPYSWEELLFVLKILKEKGIAVKILGQGTNILISDEGIRGAVIKLGQNLGNISLTYEGILEVEAGCLISKVISYMLERNLGGLEFMIGIPGTIGGAVVGNAGAWNKSIGSFVEEVIVIDENLEEKILTKNDLLFSYRMSNIKKDWIVKKVRLKVEKKQKEISMEEIKNYLKERNRRLPKYPSAGSIFKNPKEGPAAYFIESLGFKGMRIGDAMISYKHANTIINLGRAKSKDVMELIDIVRTRVKEVYGINLEPEIIFW